MFVLAYRHLSWQPVVARYGTRRYGTPRGTPHGAAAKHSGVGSLSGMGGVVDLYSLGW